MNYANKITQDRAELLALEKQQTNARLRDYVRCLRLLKAGTASTQQQAALQLNLSLRQVQRLWRRYQQDGLDKLVESQYVPYWGKLSAIQISQLRAFLFTDQAQTLASIQTFLADSFKVHYTIGGISDLCKRLKVKHKSGRPVNIRQQPGAVEAFKKSLLT
jgi:transposase